MSSRHRKPAPAPAFRPCAAGGCGLNGEHRAPLSRASLNEYQWLCLEHVREFNKSWDYFKGMPPEEIEDFQRDALHGHRPTWQRDNEAQRRAHAFYAESLREAVSQFTNWDSSRPNQPPRPRVPPKEARALAALGLREHCSPEQLKGQYRAMVKKYHPDLHPGDSLNEEKFKAITTAYHFLMKRYEAV